VLISLLFLVVEQSFSTGAAAAPATSLAVHKQLPEPGVGEQVVELFSPVLNEAIATGENACV